MRSRIRDDRYDRRYAENWGNTSKLTRKIAKDRCCFPGCRCDSTNTHHAVYQDKNGVICGRELPGVHVFPLCDRHHKIAHLRRNWIRARIRPEINNRNTAEFYRLLRKGWKAIVHPITS